MFCFADLRAFAVVATFSPVAIGFALAFAGLDDDVVTSAGAALSGSGAALRSGMGDGCSFLAACDEAEEEEARDDGSWKSVLTTSRSDEADDEDADEGRSRGVSGAPAPPKL